MDNQYIIGKLRKLSVLLKPKNVPANYKPVATFYDNHFYFGYDYSESVPIETPKFMNKITRQFAIYLISGNKDVVNVEVQPEKKEPEKPKQVKRVMRKRKIVEQPKKENNETTKKKSFGFFD